MEKNKKQILAAALAASAFFGGMTAFAAEPAWGTNTGTTNIAIGKDSKAEEFGAVAVGLQSEAGASSVATGFGSQAKDAQSAAYGQNAKAQGSGSIAVGANSSATVGGAVSIGFNSSATAESSIALGNQSVATEANTLSVGNSWLDRRVVHVAEGKNATDAVNKSQLDAVTDNLRKGGIVSGTRVDSGVSIGEGSSASKGVSVGEGVKSGYNSVAIGGAGIGKNNPVTSAGWNSVAVGTGSAAGGGGNNVAIGSGSTINKEGISNSVAVGTGSEVTVNQGTSLGQNAKTNGIRSVAIGANSLVKENEKDVVSFGVSAEDSWNQKEEIKRRLIHVADGINATDAVNKGQLDAVDQKVNTLSGRVNTLGNELDSVGAISAALAGLHPIDYDPDGSKYQISAALGSYDGSQALAMGGFYNVNEDVLLSLGVSTALKGERKTAGNLGVTFRIGAGSHKAAAETDKDVLARLAEMDRKIAMLEEKNDRLEEENADQKKQIEALEARTF